MRSDQLSVMLMVTFDLFTSQKYTYNLTKNVDAGNWINLKVSQMSGVHEIKVDYNLVYSKNVTKNFLPKMSINVNLVTGKIYGTKTTSIIVHYRNFKINTCRMKGKYSCILLSRTPLRIWTRCTAAIVKKFKFRL